MALSGAPLQTSIPSNSESRPTVINVNSRVQNNPAFLAVQNKLFFLTQQNNQNDQSNQIKKTKDRMRQKRKTAHRRHRTTAISPSLPSPAVLMPPIICPVADAKNETCDDSCYDSSDGSDDHDDDDNTDTDTDEKSSFSEEEKHTEEQNKSGLYSHVYDQHAAANHDVDWVYDIRYLTFSGGSVKGFAYAGCILALDDAFAKRQKNLYQQLAGFSGTSVGAFFALLMTLNVRGQRMLFHVLNIDVSNIVKEATLENLFHRYGLNSTHRFREQVFHILGMYTGNPNITFRELFEFTGKHFVCAVTNISRGRAEYHSHQTRPNVRVGDSVVASMSIPLLVEPTLIDQDYFADGGMCDNCPFRVFPQHQTLILFLTGNMPPLTNLQNYAMRVASLSLRTHADVQFRLLKPEHRKRAVIMRIDNVGVFDFSMTLKTKCRLVEIGATRMYYFLNRSAATQQLSLHLLFLLCAFGIAGCKPQLPPGSENHQATTASQPSQPHSHSQQNEDSGAHDEQPAETVASRVPLQRPTTRHV